MSEKQKSNTLEIQISWSLAMRAISGALKNEETTDEEKQRAEDELFRIASILDTVEESMAAGKAIEITTRTGTATVTPNVPTAIGDA